MILAVPQGLQRREDAVPREAPQDGPPPYTSVAIGGRGLFPPWKYHARQETVYEQKKAQEKDKFFHNCSGHQKSTRFSCTVSWANEIVLGSQKDCIIDGSFVATSQPEARMILKILNLWKAPKSKDQENIKCYWEFSPCVSCGLTMFVQQVTL